MADKKPISTNTSVDTKTEKGANGVTVKTIVTTTVEKYADGSSSTKTKTQTITEGASMQKIDPTTGKPTGETLNIGDAQKKASKVPVTTDDDFLQAALKAHNQYRKQHGADSLKLSPELCMIAQAWANKIAAADQMQHSDNGYGENIHWSSGVVTDGKAPVEHWYSEVKQFDFKNGDYQKGTGHFSQVVWKGSKELGIAKAAGKAGGTYVVANYNPAGNYLGLYKENVSKPK